MEWRKRYLGRPSAETEVFRLFPDGAEESAPWLATVMKFGHEKSWRAIVFPDKVKGTIRHNLTTLEDAQRWAETIWRINA